QNPSIVGEVLQHRTDAYELWLLPIPIECLWKPLVFHVKPSHHTGDRIVRCGKFQKKVSLRGGWRGLHNDSLADIVPLKRWAQVRAQVIPIKHSIGRRHPVIVATLRLPVMLMAVNSHSSP